MFLVDIIFIVVGVVLVASPTLFWRAVTELAYRFANDDISTRRPPNALIVRSLGLIFLAFGILFALADIDLNLGTLVGSVR
jgi:hypothetical protein